MARKVVPEKCPAARNGVTTTGPRPGVQVDSAPPTKMEIGSCSSSTERLIASPRDTKPTRAKRLTLWAKTEQHDWRDGLDVLGRKYDTFTFSEESWLDILDIDKDGFISRDDLIVVLWRVGVLLSMAEFNDVLRSVQLWTTAAIEESSDSDVLAAAKSASESLLHDLIGDRQSVADAIHFWAKNVSSQGCLPFYSLWFRRVCAYALGIAGDLWVPSTFGKNRDTPQNISATKLFSFFGRVLGVLHWSCVFCLMWWCWLTFSDRASDSNDGDASVPVSLAEVLCPFVLLCSVTLVVSPYREAMCYCRERRIEQEEFELKYRFRLRYIPMVLNDQTVVSMFSFYGCFMVDPNTFEFLYKGLPPRFKNRTKQRVAANSGSEEKTVSNHEQQSTVDGQDEEEKKVAATNNHFGVSWSSLFASLELVLFCGTLALVPGFVRLARYGRFLPRIGSTLSVVVVVQSFVVLLLTLHFVHLKGLASATSTSNGLDMLDRILFLCGLGTKAHVDPALHKAALFNPFETVSSLGVFKHMRDLGIAVNNYYAYQWNNIVVLTILVLNSTSIAGFLLLALFTEGHPLSVLNAVIVVWNMYTFRFLALCLFNKAAINERFGPDFVALLRRTSTTFILRVAEPWASKRHGDESRSNAMRRWQLYQHEIKEVLDTMALEVECDETNMVRLLGVTITNNLVLNVMGTMAAACASGLFKLAFADS